MEKFPITPWVSRDTIENFSDDFQYTKISINISLRWEKVSYRQGSISDVYEDLVRCDVSGNIINENFFKNFRGAGW